MAVNPNQLQVDQMTRILLAQEVTVLSAEIGPPDIELIVSIPKSVRSGRQYAASPQSFEQTVAAFGWRVFQSTNQVDAFELVLRKPFFAPGLASA